MNKCTCGRCPTTRIAKGLKCFNDLTVTVSTAPRRISCEMPVPRRSFLSKPFVGMFGPRQ